MQIGRKIYYELATGNVILDTGERQGDVVETTVDEDFALYAALQPYQRDAIGVLQLPFGACPEEFAMYTYSVNPLSRTINWGVPLNTGPTLDEVKAAKIAQLDDFCQRAIANGFISPTTGHHYRTNTDDQINFLATKDDLVENPTIENVDWKTEDSGLVTHSRADFLAAVAEGKQHKRDTIARFWSLKAQIEAATDAEAVNAIQW